MSRFLFPILLNSILLLVLAGCLPKGGGTTGDDSLLLARKIEGEAALSIFLQGKKTEGPGVWMQVSDCQVRSGDQWYPVALARREIRSREIEKVGQLILGRGGLPAGDYDSLRFTVDKAALEREGKKIFLSLDETVVLQPFRSPLTLSEGDSLSLFLTWDTKASLKGKAILSPVMELEVQSIPLTTDLAYVSCPEIDTVYIVRTDRNRICGSIGVNGRPTVIEVRPRLNRFYVLSAADPSIRIFELNSNRQLDKVRIPLSRETAYMAVGPEGRWAYVLDKENRRLLRLDLFNGSLSGRINLGARPQYVLYAEDRGLLAVSSAYGHEVSFIDPDDLSLVQTITTGGSPDGLLFYEDYLYIAENSTGLVIVYDLTNNKIQSRVKVGRGPRRLIENNNHIYVTNFDGRSISVLVPGQLNVFREIRLTGKPFEMAVSSPRQWLYAGDSQTGGVYLLDLSSNQVIKTIDLEAVPFDLAVVDQ